MIGWGVVRQRNGAVFYNGRFVGRVRRGMCHSHDRLQKPNVPQEGGIKLAHHTSKTTTSSFPSLAPPSGSPPSPPSSSTPQRNSPAPHYPPWTHSPRGSAAWLLPTCCSFLFSPSHPLCPSPPPAPPPPPSSAPGPAPGFAAAAPCPRHRSGCRRR